MSSLNCQGCDWFAKSWEAGAKRNCKKMGPSLIVFWPEQWNQHKSNHAKCSKHSDGTFGSPCKLPWRQHITSISGPKPISIQSICSVSQRLPQHETRETHKITEWYHYDRTTTALRELNNCPRKTLGRQRRHHAAFPSMLEMKVWIQLSLLEAFEWLPIFQSSVKDPLKILMEPWAPWFYNYNCKTVCTNQNLLNCLPKSKH